MHDSRLLPPSPSSELPLPTPVLVVEDEPLIQQRLARIWRSWATAGHALLRLQRWLQRGNWRRSGITRWRWSIWACPMAMARR